MNIAAIRIIAFVFAGLATLAVTSGADAADPAGSWRKLPPVEDAPAPRYQELLSGWYLRGDLGYRINSVSGVDALAPATGTKADKTLAGTFGFGYKYQWFRTDFTFDTGSPGQLQATTATGTQPQYMDKVRWRSGLINGYFDMGTWWGFTPYVGAGVGMTQLRSQTFVDGDQVGSRGKIMNVSWAAMAGVSYQVAPSWVIDVGYRYLALGNLSKPEGTGPTITAPVFQNLAAQEIRVGVRFLFD